MDIDFPRSRLSGQAGGTNRRFETYVYVANVDREIDRLRAAGVNVLVEPEDMPWGERLVHIDDPEGNPVALAAPVAQTVE